MQLDCAYWSLKNDDLKLVIFLLNVSVSSVRRKKMVSGTFAHNS